MRFLFAELPAWAQVTIALAVPLNTFLGIVGVIVMRRTERRSRWTQDRVRREARRVSDLEEEVGTRRNGVVR